MNQGTQSIPHRPDAASQAESGFELPQNLRFAQYHRIQAAGDAEYVTHHLGMGQIIKVGADRILRLAVKVGDEVSDQHHPVLSVHRVGQHLCSITGRKNQTLGNGRLGGEALQRFLQP